MRQRNVRREVPRREPIARVNEAISVADVRLIGEHGEQLGVKSIDEARSYAYERDLDLVEVAPTAVPPVARAMDFGKYRYEQEQKAKLARKNQVEITIKEIRLRPKIGPHDYETKKRRALGFLEHRDKVRVVVLLRGREREHPERGRDLLTRFAHDVESRGKIEGNPLNEGRRVSIMLAPTAHAVPSTQPEPES